jgi:hypothetical protein
MIADKTFRYQNAGTDLTVLADNIASYLRSEGFEVQTAIRTAVGLLIQARRGGFLKGIITAERALSIPIQGQPKDFTVRIGIGKWIQNIAVAAVETVALRELFMPLDVAEMLWTVQIENKLKMGELVETPIAQAR